MFVLIFSFDPQIVLSKLRSQTAMDHDRKHLKAAKALVIVIPLFGFTYILTFIGPDEASLYFYNIFLCSLSRESFPWATQFSSPSEQYSSLRQDWSSLCRIATVTVRSAELSPPGTSPELQTQFYVLDKLTRLSL